MLSFPAGKDFEAPDDADSDGIYEVTVRVSDGDRSDTANIRVTLSNRNEAPTADAGVDQVGIEEGATVNLSGTGEDPDGRSDGHAVRGIGGNHDLRSADGTDRGRDPVLQAAGN